MAKSRLPKRPFGRVFAKAATRLQNLGVAGTAAVAAAALASWPILAVGGAAYAALVAWDLASPDFWKRALGAGAPEAVVFPDASKLSHPPLREAVTAILASREEIARVLGETPPDIVGNLSGALAQVAELERHAALLIERGEDLSKYLATVKPELVRAEIDELARKAKGARDAEARAGYESARQARAEQLQALDDIGDARERIAAKLATIIATLEALPPKVVRMRALDGQAMDELTGSVREELTRMNGEIKLFEETLRTLAEVPQV